MPEKCSNGAETTVEVEYAVVGILIGHEEHDGIRHLVCSTKTASGYLSLKVLSCFTLDAWHFPLILRCSRVWVSELTIEHRSVDISWQNDVCPEPTKSTVLGQGSFRHFRSFQ